MANERMLRTARELAARFAETYAVRDLNCEYPSDEMEMLKKSGILAAPVPTAYGGLEMSAEQLIRAIMILAEGNPSIAQMFLVHCVIGAQFVEEFGTEHQKREIFRAIVEEHAFIGNASSEKNAKHQYAFETTLTAAADGRGHVLNGRKFFTTGSKAADWFLVLAMMDGAFAAGFVRPNAPGLVMLDDWKPMGQRGTASGSIEFTNVRVAPDMVIPTINIVGLKPDNAFGPLTQGGFTAVYVGAAKGALRTAVAYIKSKTRPLTGSGVKRAVEDPYILEQVGKLSAQTSACESFLLSASKTIDEIARIRANASAEELAQVRARASVAISEAKVFCSEAALRVCQDLFQACGARSALAEEDLDRYWRDVRTLSLHDPMSYKSKQIGEFLLQDKYPEVSLRS